MVKGKEVGVWDCDLVVSVMKNPKRILKFIKVRSSCVSNEKPKENTKVHKG
jgi:hypothetical protein